MNSVIAIISGILNALPFGQKLVKRLETNNPTIEGIAEIIGYIAIIYVVYLVSKGDLDPDTGKTYIKQIK